MYIRIPKKKNILFIDDSFATLDDIDVQGNLTYSFRYFIDQVRVIDNDDVHACITISSSFPDTDEPASAGDVSPKKLVDTILKGPSNRRNQKRAILDRVLSTKLENLSLRIDNETHRKVRDLKAGRIKKLRHRNVEGGSPISFYTRKLVLHRVDELDANDKHGPVLQLDVNALVENDEDAQVRAPTKAEMLSLLLKEGIDPADTSRVNRDLISARESISGLIPRQEENELLRDKRSSLESVVRRLTNKRGISQDSRQLARGNVIPCYDRVRNNFREMCQTITVPADAIEDGTFFVKIEVIDRRNVTIDLETRKIDTARDIRIFNAVRRPPTIRQIASREPGRVKLQIKQNDRAADRVRLYRKVVYDHEPQLMNARYEFLREIDLVHADDFMTVDVDITSSSATIYRVVAIGRNDNASLRFASIAIRPANKKTKHVGAALSLTIVQSGISIDPCVAPVNAIAVRILRRDCTLFEQKFTQIETPDPIRRLDEDTNLTFVDTAVKRNHVYEYKAEFYYRTGEQDSSRAQGTIEFIPFEDGAVVTTLTDRAPVLDGEQLDYTFTINTEIKTEQLDLIKQLLEQNDVADFFEADILKERDAFKQLLAFNIIRTNLTNGDRENFGTIIDTNFSDRASRERNGVSPLEPGSKYRYEVRTLLRVPETLFSEFEKSSIVNGKKFKYRPFAFRHPLTLTRGNIVTKESTRTRHAKDDMTFGSIGNTVTTIATFNQTLTTPAGVQAEKINRRLIVIRWRQRGKSELIDHFIIRRNTATSRSIIARVHAHLNLNSFELFHTIDDNDAGKTTYTVTPVYNDYSLGFEVESNPLVII